MPERRLRHVVPTDADCTDLAELDDRLGQRSTSSTAPTGTPSDGGQSIDLDGATDAGPISQAIPTVAGQDYDVKFRYTANPESADPAPDAWPSWIDGDPVGSTFTTRAPAAPTPISHPIAWKDGSVAFTATGASTDADLRVD